MIPIKDTQAPAFTLLVTIILCVNIIMFIEELSLGPQILEPFSVSPFNLLSCLKTGQPDLMDIHLSILVSGFMHGGYIHLFANMVFFLVFGPGVEKALGPLKFILFYLSAIFVSFYTHTLVHASSNIPVIGASGAIAAIMGAHMIFYPRARISTIIPLLFFIRVIEIPSIVFMPIWFGLQAANGCISPGMHEPVAWFSHIGGFIFGLACSIHSKWLK
ncbi:MAG: rhomboid family intramembrane serine protease [Thermodesulfobacteriota bacterium]|nr:rhomboid family intramembrane serine protease [Thermodesulfobacteriota bacterium]